MRALQSLQKEPKRPDSKRKLKLKHQCPRRWEVMGNNRQPYRNHKQQVDHCNVHPNL